MTVSTTSNRRPFAGNGTATDFDFDDPVQDVAHLDVVLIDDSTGAVASQTHLTHYTVTGIGDADGITVRFLIPPPTGKSVLIRVVVPRTQPTNFANLGRYSPSVHTAALNRLVQQVQALWERVSRTLQFSVYGNEIEGLGSVSGFLNRYLFVNSSGQVVPVTGDPSQPITHDVYQVTAIEGQTEIPVAAGYTPGAFNLSVYKHAGGKLFVGVDYTETDSTRITLATPAAGGDIFELNVGEVYNTAVARSSKYVEYKTGITGDTITLTSFTFTPGQNEIDVFYNGAMLDPPANGGFTETNETTITLPFPLISSDAIVVIAGRVYDTSSLPNGSVTDAALASALNLSAKAITLPSGCVTAGNLAATLDLSAKAVTLPAGGVTAGNLAATLNLSGKAVTLPDNSVTDAKLNLAANASAIKTALSAVGDPPIFGARAFCAFNGTGTPAILAAGNVASITDLGVGVYKFTFTVAMPDANYTIIPGGNGTSDTPGSGGRQFPVVRTRTAADVILEFLNDGGAAADPSYASFAVFR